MQRLPFVDWARGFAVVAMVLWHTGDGWLRPALKAGEGFFFLRFVGGLAAPSFLMLAGVAAALGARGARDEHHANQIFRGSFGRGLEVLLLGYALRLQTWLLDAGALRSLGTYRAWLPLLGGYLLLLLATRALATRPRRALLLGAPGAALLALGLWQVESVATGRYLRLLQVDVLQAIGAALMLLALFERGAQLLQRPIWLLLLAVSVLLVTQPLGASLPGPLPIPIAAYLGRFPARSGAPNPALFPLFPWFGYALLGAAYGACLRLYPRYAERVVVGCVVLGAAVATLSSEAHHFVQQAVAQLPWCVPLVRTAFRAGVVLLLLGIGYAFPHGRLAATLADFGRASLRIYWIHLIFAYGILARPLHAKLDYARWAALASLLLLAMWGISRIGQRPRAAPVRT